MTSLRAVSTSLFLAMSFSLTSPAGFAADIFTKKHHHHPPVPAPYVPPSLPQTEWVRVPSLTNVTCDDRAQSLGRDFAATAKVTVDAAKCSARVALDADDSAYNLDSIIISYSSPTKAETYTATFGSAEGDQLPSVRSGIYPSYKECLADIGSQGKVFEEQTGLKVFAAWCDASPFNQLMPYTMRIEGIGVPKLKLFAYSPPSGEPSTLKLFDWVKGLLLVQPQTTIVKETRRGLFYYSPRSVPLTHGTLSLFTSFATCQAQLADAQAMMTNNVKLKALVQCIPVGSDANFQGPTAMEAVWNGYDLVTGQAPREVVDYYSLTTCLGDKARVIANEKKAGRYVVGAICREGDRTPNTYVMDILEEL